MQRRKAAAKAAARQAAADAEAAAEAEKNKSFAVEVEREAEVEEAAAKRDEKVSRMHERELRAEAMRRRLAVQNPALAGTVEKCAQCKEYIMVVPFERLNHVYCSIECLRDHKNILGE